MPWSAISRAIGARRSTCSSKVRFVLEVVAAGSRQAHPAVGHRLPSTVATLFSVSAPLLSQSDRRQPGAVCLNFALSALESDLFS